MKNKVQKVLVNLMCGIFVILSFLLTFVCLLSFCFNLCYIKTSVRGYSMQPTFNAGIVGEDVDGDTVFINKYAGFSRGDVVVANVSWLSKGPIIKRMVADEGDTIKILEEDDKYCLYVNGEKVDSKPITTRSDHGITYGTVEYHGKFVALIESKRGTREVVVDEQGDECLKMMKGYCFLIGDNWAESTDSVTKGPIKKTQVLGKVDFVIKTDESQFKIFLFMLKLAFC